MSGVSPPPSAWPTAAPGAGPFTEASAVRAWLSARRPGRLALDVEADGIFRYRARVCTVQLADAERIAVVDTLAVPVAEVLGVALADPDWVKIVHDASFDARLLREYGAPLVAVFDTAVAARFLGYSETGLASMLARHFGVTLRKEQQHSDWGLRPLPEEAMDYLHDDVRYLPALADALELQLEAKDICAEFHVECEYVLSQAAHADEARPPWLRVKGAGKLTAAARAVLREVAWVRESLARDRNVPAGRLLPNGLMVAVAERRPRGAAQFETLVRRARLTAGEREQLLDAVERGIQARDVPPAELAVLHPEPPSPEVCARQRRRRQVLTQFRRDEASGRDVDPQAVLPGHCMKELLGLDDPCRDSLAEVPGLGECRLQRYGDALLAALREADN